MQLRVDTVEWREVEGEIVALDLRDQMYLGVNGSGTVLWPLLVDGTTMDDLTAALVATYGISEDVAAGDAGAFVEMLAGRDLLTDADGK